MKSRLALFSVLLISLGGLAACGGKAETVTHAPSEAAYFTVGELRYQVQLSRQLNPTDREDRDYLTGIAPQDQQLPSDQTFFAVFLRVENQTNKPVLSARDFTIIDTQGNKFKPVRVDNTSSYKSITLPAGGRDPDGDEPATYEPTQGKMLLFKLPNASLDNRPLELKVISPAVPQQEGSVELDV